MPRLILRAQVCPPGADAARIDCGSHRAADRVAPSNRPQPSVVPGSRSAPCWAAWAGKSGLSRQPPEYKSPWGERSVHLPGPIASPSTRAAVQLDFRLPLPGAAMDPNLMTSANRGAGARKCLLQCVMLLSYYLTLDSKKG